MRSIFISVLLLLLTSVSAQNWAPVDRNEKFNFSLAGLNYISNTIWVDSAFSSGPDSMFYLNRIVTDCDTCPAGFKLCNQPGFLKKKMFKRAGGVYELRIPGSLVIHTLAAIDQSWLYDTANSVTATMYAKSYTAVFGSNDSVELINLSGGGSLQLSKNHGILQFTGFPATNINTLEGIEGRNLGELVPKFAEIYNFQPGDVFQYHEFSMNYGVGNGYERLIKTTIISKDSSTGNYSYYIRKINSGWSVDIIGHHGDTAHLYELTTMTYSDSLMNQANFYPGRIVENVLDNFFTSYIHIGVDSLGIYDKWIGNYSYYVPGMFLHGDLLQPPQPFELLFPMQDPYFIRDFKPGLGNTADDYSYFEAVHAYDLIGYVKNGDTVGRVYPDDFLLEGVHQPVPLTGPVIYPDPCTNQLHIIGFPQGRNINMLIKDISGRDLLSLSGGSTIEVSSLKPGIYFLFLSDESGCNLWRTRFIKR